MPSYDKISVRVMGSDTRVFVAAGTSKPALLLVHGFRGDHHGLLQIAAGLTEFNVYIADLPGFGESSNMQEAHTLDAYARWLAQMPSALGISDYSVVGHSFGSIVVAAALAAGLSPKKTVLINPISQPALLGDKRFLTALSTMYYELGAKLPEPLAAPLLKSRVVVRLMSEIMAKTRDKRLRGWIHDQHHRYFSVFTDRKTLLAAYLASISHTVTDFKDSISMPTLLIAGERDDITPLAATLALQKQLPDAKLKVFAETGHLIHYENAAETASLISNFLLLERASTGECG